MGALAKIRDFFYEPQLALPAPAEPVSLPPSARGSDGVIAYGGWVSDGESNSKLTGAQKWITYANAINTDIVATGVRYFGNLLAGTEWHAEPNAAGGASAERGAEIVRAGLLDASFGDGTPKAWGSIVKKAAMYRLHGFSLFATAIRYSAAHKQIVYSDIAHRPQHTIEQWLRDDQQQPFRAVVQRVLDGQQYEIPLNECLYCVDDLLSNGPEGTGLLRHVIKRVERLERYQTLEWLAYEGDMAGMPIGRAPLAELRALCPSSDEAEKAAFVTAAITTLKTVLANRVKTPEHFQYVMLDSSTYENIDKKTVSIIQKWAIEFAKSVATNLGPMDVSIKRLEFQIARVLGIEFALVGAEGGSYSMHEDKTSMFATNLSSTLSELGTFATSQLARRLVALNGLDPETCTPKLVAEPINQDSVESATKSLMQIQLAKLHPLDPARAVLRKRLRLPPEDPATIAALVKAWDAAATKPEAPAAVDPAKEAA